MLYRVLRLFLGGSYGYAAAGDGIQLKMCWILESRPNLSVPKAVSPAQNAIIQSRKEIYKYFISQNLYSPAIWLSKETIQNL